MAGPPPSHRTGTEPLKDEQRTRADLRAAVTKHTTDGGLYRRLFGVVAARRCVNRPALFRIRGIAGLSGPRGRRAASAVRRLEVVAVDPRERRIALGNFRAQPACCVADVGCANRARGRLCTRSSSSRGALARVAAASELARCGVVLRHPWRCRAARARTHRHHITRRDQQDRPGRHTAAACALNPRRRHCGYGTRARHCNLHRLEAAALAGRTSRSAAH